MNALKRYSKEEILNLENMLISKDVASISLACQIIENNEGEYSLGNMWNIYLAAETAKDDIMMQYIKYKYGLEEDIRLLMERLDEIKYAIVPLI